MARGYPDFFGYSTFPWFGEMIDVPAGANLPALGVWTDIVNIQAKGVIHSGFVRVTAVTNFNLLAFRITHDTQVHGIHAASGYWGNELYWPQDLIIFVHVYDEVNQVFGAGVRPGISFSSQFRIEGWNNTAFIMNAGCEITYHLIR